MLGKSPSEIMDELYERLGRHVMLEESLTFTREEEAAVRRDILEKKNLPAFDRAIERVTYEDGCKVYFTDGSFAVCRFSGTEPLIRLCAEAPDEQQAQACMTAFKRHIEGLLGR